jgi:signal peptidase II
MIPLYFIIIALVAALDQLTKYLIRSSMELNSSIPLLDGIFHITYVHNSGAAFSILQGKTGLLIAVQIVVIAAVLTYLIKKRKKDHWCLLLALSLILAGGVGNLIDRAANGYVVDFLDFRFWPIFNVADISVCTGCGLLAVYLLFFESKRRENPDAAQNGDSGGRERSGEGTDGKGF